MKTVFFKTWLAGISAAFLLSASWAIAQDVLESESAPTEQAATTEPIMTSAEAIAAIVRMWPAVQEAMKHNNLTLLDEQINQMVSLRNQAGITDLPDYASRLIDRGEQKLRPAEGSDARLYYRWGYRLAPNSPEVLWRVMPLASRFGLGSPVSIMIDAISATMHSPIRLMVTVQQSLYPVLLAISFALVISIVVIVASQVLDIFRVLAWRVAPDRRGWVVPLLYLGLFALAPAFGLLWCLAIWSVALYMLVPERRFFSLLSAVLIFAWGVLIPVRENLATWLSDPQVRRIVLSGDQPLADEEIAPLTEKVHDLSGDTVLQFKFAQLLRRSGKLAESEKMLVALSQSHRDQAWLHAERGIIKFIRNDLADAERELRKAVELDGSSPEALFNLSRVIFEGNNTRESREVIGRALKIDRGRIEALQQREDALGSRDPRSFADVELGLSNYFSSALAPNVISFDQAHQHSSRRMWGMDPGSITIAGLLLILMHLIPHERARRINPRGLFDQCERSICAQWIVRIVPGGFLITAGHVRSGFLILSALTLLAMPIITGAYAEGRSFDTLDWFMPYHCCGLILIYLGLTLCALNRSEEH